MKKSRTPYIRPVAPVWRVGDRHRPSCRVWNGALLGGGVALLLLGMRAASGPGFPFGTAQAADPQGYAVVVKPSGDASLDGMIQASSTLLSLQKTSAVGPYALAGRIRGDYDRIKGALESLGHYDGAVTISVAAPGSKSVDGRDPSLPQWLQDLPKGTRATITISTQSGPVFRIGHITLASGPVQDQKNAGPTGGTTPVTLDSAQRAAFGLREGQPAVASDILAAQGNLQTALQEEGHAQANVSAPVAYLRPATQTLDLTFHVGMGPVVDIGPIHFSGLSHVRERYLRRRLTIHEGQLYQPSTIEAARQDLAAVGVFASVAVRNQPPLVALANGRTTPGVSQGMPLDFTFQEAKRHTVSAQIGYSTDLGGRVGASWTHHNLLGAAEQLKLTALITGVGGTAQQGLGYDVYADFLKPDFFRRDQNLSLRVEGIRQLLYSYHQTALLVRGGITRRLTRHWSVAGSLSVEQEAIRQFGDTRDYFIASVPLSATFDNTDLSNPIDPATHGMRFNANVTPSESLEHGDAFFTIMSAAASTYFDLHRLGLTRPGRSVIAVRGLVGSVQGASTYQIPPDQRLYAGGPATVRGFRYQGVGPQYGKYGIGGTSLDAGTVEYRQRFGKSFGAAAFVDAGQVGAGSRPFQGTLRVGYGAGVRYYTPIGPVRLDVALPANRPPHGDKWELYIGLGETF